MMWTQLVYGVIAATNIALSPTMFDPGGSPLSINGATRIEVFEAVNERAAAIGWPGPLYEPTLPFTFSETNEAGYEFGVGLLSNWASRAYMLTNGSWKVWSYNPWRYPDAIDPERYFLPWVGWSGSAFEWAQAARAVERMAPYYVRASTPTTITMWTAADLWTAAGSTNGNPFPFAEYADWYQHVGTSKVSVLRRALTNLTTTPVIVTLASNVNGRVYSATNADPIAVEVTGPRPTWVTDMGGGLAFQLNLTNGAGVNLTNTVAGHAPAYSATTGVVAAVESIRFTGYLDWVLNFANLGGSEEDDWWKGSVSNKITQARKADQAFYCPVQEMAVGVTGRLDFAVSAEATIRRRHYTLTNDAVTVTNFWSTNLLSAPFSFAGLGTNWAGSLVVTAAPPDVSSCLDLTSFVATGVWDTVGLQADDAGHDGSPYVDVSVALDQPRFPVIRWNFTRCHPD